MKIDARCLDSEAVMEVDREVPRERRGSRRVAALTEWGSERFLSSNMENSRAADRELPRERRTFGAYRSQGNLNNFGRDSQERGTSDRILPPNRERDPHVPPREFRSNALHQKQLLLLQPISSPMEYITTSSSCGSSTPPLPASGHPTPPSANAGAACPAGEQYLQPTPSPIHPASAAEDLHHPHPHITPTYYPHSAGPPGNCSAAVAAAEATPHHTPLQAASSLPLTHWTSCANNTSNTQFSSTQKSSRDLPRPPIHDQWNKEWIKTMPGSEPKQVNGKKVWFGYHLEFLASIYHSFFKQK